MTSENKKYIFTVKNLLVLNTPMKEVEDILNDLVENTEENISNVPQNTEKILLKNRFGLPLHFVKELKDNRKNAAFIKTGRFPWPGRRPVFMPCHHLRVLRSGGEKPDSVC